MKLDLQVGEIVQGSLSLSDRNLMLVWQVNCPGCLARALPMLMKINNEHADVFCFAMSSAFEDFNFNNLNSTKALLEQGELTLHSKRYFSQIGHKILPYKFELPVVMDWFLDDAAITNLPDAVFNVLDRERLSPGAEQQIKKHLEQRLLPVTKIGRTFLNNEFQGTPTWVYFDRELEIIECWLGHKTLEWVSATLKK